MDVNTHTSLLFLICATFVQTGQKSNCFGETDFGESEQYKNGYAIEPGCSDQFSGAICITTCRIMSTFTHSLSISVKEYA